VELGTHFINKSEKMIKIKQLGEIVNRVDVLRELFDLELLFQYHKFKLLENYYYIYENTVEPLNAHKVAKTIITVMYLIPTIDL
jgi:hypothetical protein